MEQFKVGDFDLVLLGSSIPAEHKERLTGLVRTSGSRTPRGLHPETLPATAIR